MHSVTATSNSLLTEPLWSGHIGNCVWVSNFMTDKRYDGPTAALLSPYVCKSVQSRAVLASGSVTNKQTRPATASFSQRLYRPWFQSSETGSLMWAQESDSVHVNKWLEKTDNASLKTVPVQATHDTGLQRQLPPSFPGCPAMVRQSDASRLSSALCVA